MNFLWYILSYDIWFYFSHLILSNPVLYKTIHKENPSCTSEIQCMGVVLPFLIDLNTHNLFYALMFIHIRSLLRHDVRFTWLIGNHHLLHHQYPYCNFGEYWLDSLLGTKYPNTNEYVFGLIYT